MYIACKLISYILDKTVFRKKCTLIDSLQANLGSKSILSPQQYWKIVAEHGCTSFDQTDDLKK